MSSIVKAFLFCHVELEVFRERTRINRKIEKKLSKDKLHNKNKFKLLLLGTRGSGKSTYVKQMRIIHGPGYSEHDKRHYVNIIFQNILMAMQTLIEAMEFFQVQYAKALSNDNAKLIQSIGINDITSDDRSAMDVVKALWNDEGVKQCYEQHNYSMTCYEKQYRISDSTKYFLSNIDRISEEDYVPTEQDILRCRVPTTGVVEYSFNIQRNHFCLVDVGGRRSERRKWIHCFENVASVIFMAALSDYNEKHQSIEDGQNRLDVSIALFNVTRNNPWLQNSSIILFLNKKDLLEEKIATSHLEDYFPQYNGPKYDAVSAQNFILEQFCGTEDIKSSSRIFSHFACATDTSSMRVPFEAVNNTILEQNLSDYLY